MGFEGNHEEQVNGIWKESVKKDFWSYKRDCTWRIKTNDELDELIRHKNITNHINYIKARRLTL